MKRVILLSTALIMVISAVTLASGLRALPVFQGGVGARALAMGGAFVAVADDGTAPYWNPAGLAILDDTRVYGMSTDLFGLGAAKQVVGAVTTFANIGIGLGWEHVSVLADDLTDDEGNPIASSTWGASAIVGSLATSILDIGLAGANVKYYMGEAFGDTANGIGFDLGLMVNLGDMFTIGVNAIDLGGTTFEWSTGAVDSVDSLYKAGMAMKLVDGMLILASDIDFAGTAMGDAHVGVEFKVIEELALRGGATLTNNFQDVIFGVGAGISVAGLTVDAAYVLEMEEKLGNTLVLSAEFSLGGLLGSEEGPGAE